MSEVKVTAEDVKAATMHGIMFLDGEDFYENHFQCTEFPEVVRVKRGPAHDAPGRKAGKEAMPHTSTLYVDGVEVPSNLQAIADAINAFRARGTTP